MNELKKLNKLNNELDKKLNKEDSLIMTDMVCYIRGAGLSEKNQELIRQDLLEMALSAQERNESFSMVVGQNYKEFCDDIIASMPKMTIREKFLNYLDMMLLCVSILMVIATLLSSDALRIIKGIFTGVSTNFNVSYSLGTVVLNIIIIIISVGIVEYICKTSFEITKKIERDKTMPKKKLIPKRFFIGAIWGLLVAVGLISLIKFASFTVINANFFIVLIIAGVMYLIHKIINLQQ